MFYENTLELLRAFIDCESRDYKWATEEAREEFKKRLWDEIHFIEPLDKVNYIRIQSHSNMGSVVKELVLTPTNGHYSWQGKDLVIMLGTSPRDPVRLHWVEPAGYGIRDMVNGQL